MRDTWVGVLSVVWICFDKWIKIDSTTGTFLKIALRVECCETYTDNIDK